MRAIGAALIAASTLTLAACGDSPAEQAVEREAEVAESLAIGTANRMETQAEALENRAESTTGAAAERLEAEADKLEEQAEKTRDAVDEIGDRIEDAPRSANAR